MSNAIKFTVDGVVMVTANDHDAEVEGLKENAADTIDDLHAELRTLKAENERLKGCIKILDNCNECGEVYLERDALRTKLDEARELLSEPEGNTDHKWADTWREKRDAWLEANKV